MPAPVALIFSYKEGKEVYAVISLLYVKWHTVKCETKTLHQRLQRIEDYKADLDLTLFAFDWSFFFFLCGWAVQKRGTEWLSHYYQLRHILYIYAFKNFLGKQTCPLYRPTQSKKRLQKYLQQNLAHPPKNVKPKVQVTLLYKMTRRFLDLSKCYLTQKTQWVTELMITAYEHRFLFLYKPPPSVRTGGGGDTALRGIVIHGSLYLRVWHTGLDSCK